MDDLTGKLGELASFLLKALIVVSILRIGMHLLGIEIYIPVVDEFLNFIYAFMHKTVSALDRVLGSKFGMGSVF